VGLTRRQAAKKLWSMVAQTMLKRDLILVRSVRRAQVDWRNVRFGNTGHLRTGGGLTAKKNHRKQNQADVRSFHRYANNASVNINFDFAPKIHSLSL